MSSLDDFEESIGASMLCLAINCTSRPFEIFRFCKSSVKSSVPVPLTSN